MPSLTSRSVAPLVSLLVACGPTGPSTNHIPALGTYHVHFSFDQPNPFGGVLTGTVDGDVTVTAASASTLAVTVGGEDFTGTATVLGWNQDAYLVYVPIFGGGVIAQIRFAPRLTGCTGSVRYPSDTFTIYGCTVTRDD